MLAIVAHTRVDLENIDKPQPQAYFARGSGIGEDVAWFLIYNAFDRGEKPRPKGYQLALSSL